MNARPERVAEAEERGRGGGAGLRWPEEIETMRRLKRAQDPNGIMNPGKFFD